MKTDAESLLESVDLSLCGFDAAPRGSKRGGGGEIRINAGVVGGEATVFPPSARMTETASQNSEKHQKLSRTSRTGELWLRLPPLLLLLINHTHDIFKISSVYLISLF